jgi:3-hydroxyacyl-[acyl-carrier-protein] dehydratase
MPPQFVLDLSQIDLDAVRHGPAVIEEVNPQRGLMRHLDAIVWHNDRGDIIGYKEVGEDEFWVPGHIPGRPLLPGVIMLEAAAQVSSFCTKHILGWPGFIGFGGVENCKFRQAVEPGCRLYILCHLVESRHRRVRAQCQGMVKGKLVFEADIIGTKMG